MIEGAFKPGDLVYGRGEARIKYEERDIFKDIFRNNGIIDHYPVNAADKRFLSEGGGKIPEDSQKFMDFLEERPALKNISKAVRKGFPEKFADEARVFGRKCKDGLEWAAKNDKPVHFVLDDMDMEGVVDKSSDVAYRYTSRELRYLYRNRNNKIAENVQFWKEGKPVEAPWKSDPELWSRYKPKSTGNLAGEGETSSAVNTAANGSSDIAEGEAEHSTRGALRFADKTAEDFGELFLDFL